MNRYNPQKHHRRSIRLKGYDYSQAGLYFITICTQYRACLFGEIRRGDPCGRPMILNNAGKMIETEWLNLKNRFPNIELHEFVIMPNHFHGILEITVGATVGVAQNEPFAQNDDKGQNEPFAQNDDKGQPQGIAPTGKTVGEMVGAFESITTNEYIRNVKNNGWERFNEKLWQRNYWEHIIRNQNEYNRISQYIIDNPIKWKNDKLNGGDGNVVMEPQMQYNEEPWMI